MILTVVSHVRTNNFSDPQLLDKLSQAWQSASRLLDDSNTVRYGVYHQYESNYKGNYTLSIAVEAASLAADAGSHEHLELPDSTHYKIFPVDSSDELGVVKAWQNIWELEEAGALNRAYTYDFEKYNTDGSVEIHIATKAF